MFWGTTMQQIFISLSATLTKSLKGATKLIAKKAFKIEDDDHEANLQKGDEFFLKVLGSRYYFIDMDGKHKLQFKIDEKKYRELLKDHSGVEEEPTPKIKIQTDNTTYIGEPDTLNLEIKAAMRNRSAQAIAVDVMEQMCKDLNLPGYKFAVGSSSWYTGTYINNTTRVKPIAIKGTDMSVSSVFSSAPDSELCIDFQSTKPIVQDDFLKSFNERGREAFGTTPGSSFLRLTGNEFRLNFGYSTRLANPDYVKKVKKFYNELVDYFRALKRAQ